MTRAVDEPRRISEPGIYDLPMEVYHGWRGEPCDAPSISSSGLRQVLDCPAKYWWNSPLNPNRPRVDKPEWSIGRAAHDLILQGEKEFRRANAVLSPDVDLRTKDGRAIRDRALAEGLNVLRHEDWLMIAAMRDALLAHEFAGAAFTNGAPERSIVWKDAETGVWLRARPDWLPAVPLHIPDYKTAASAKPSEFRRAIYQHGYHQQAALALDGIEAVTGERPRSFYFVAQEKEPPFVVTCVALDSVAIEWGRIQNRAAIRLFADCLARDHWPGYAEDVVEVSLPIYAERELQAQLDAGRFEPKENAA